MVDAEQARGAPDVDMAAMDPPKERRLKRSSTAPRKQEAGGLMGLFGSLRKNTRPDPPERRKSRSNRDGALTEPERDERRLRRDERRRPSVRADTDAEGFHTDAAGAAAGETETEDAEARKAARRAKRSSRQAPSDYHEMEAREAGERRAKRKEKELARQAREQAAREEEEARLLAEKQARRAAREERRAKEEQAAREAEAAAEAKAAERRERRRLREEEMAAKEMAAKAKRRRSRVDEPPPEVYPDEVEDRPRGSRTADEKDRRRRSKAAPQERTRTPRMTGGLNHGNTGGPKKDKISSWVYSQSDDPPDPPPFVETVVDMAPADQVNAHSLSSDEEARRAVRRRARRRAKYGDMPDEEIEELRSRRQSRVKSSSGSGDYERERGMRSNGSRHGAPPSSGAKKPSWFKKIF
jgi:hypothetical protein